MKKYRYLKMTILPKLTSQWNFKKTTFNEIFYRFENVTTYQKKTTNIFTHENVQDYQMSMKKDLSHEVTQKTLKLKIQS